MPISQIIRRFVTCNCDVYGLDIKLSLYKVRMLKTLTVIMYGGLYLSAHLWEGKNNNYKVTKYFTPRALRFNVAKKSI